MVDDNQDAAESIAELLVELGHHVQLTGYGQEQDRRRSMDAGFDGHLVKPVDLEVLTSIVTD